MEQTLERFVLDWNRLYKNMIFSYQKAPVTGRVTDVEVRFVMDEHSDQDGIGSWNRLADKIILKSHGTMFVATNRYLFEAGIIGIKVASQSKDYQEQRIIETLDYIGRAFLPYLEIA